VTNGGTRPTEVSDLPISVGLMTEPPSLDAAAGLLI
jgi:hypothetical protein